MCRFIVAMVLVMWVCFIEVVAQEEVPPENGIIQVLNLEQENVRFRSENMKLRSENAWLRRSQKEAENELLNLRIEIESLKRRAMSFVDPDGPTTILIRHEVAL